MAIKEGIPSCLEPMFVFLNFVGDILIIFSIAKILTKCLSYELVTVPDGSAHTLICFDNDEYAVVNELS